MSEPGAASVVRPVIAPMRWLLYAASTLVFLAGLQLTVFPEQTDTYFAWTIAPPLTAAFLGAAYWAAVPVELTAARETVWAKARVAVPAIWLFTTLTLVATLVHFDRFHFSSPIASAQGAAWFWLAIYAGVPVAMLLIGWLQIRAPGGDPPRGAPAPSWMRVLGRAGGVDLPGLPAEHPPGRPGGAPDSPMARSVLNRPRRFMSRSVISATRVRRNRMPKAGKRSGRTVNLLPKVNRIHGTWTPKIAVAIGLWMRNGSEFRGHHTPAYRRSASSVGRPVRRIAVATESMS